MRKATILTTAAWLIACASLVAGEFSIDRKVYTLTSTTTNAATAVVVTDTGFRGWIEEIRVDMSTATSGTIAVAIDPYPATGTDIAVYTKALSADTVVRPMRQEVGNTGTGVGTYAPYCSVGDTLKLTGSLFSATNKVIYVTVIYTK